MKQIRKALLQENIRITANAKNSLTKTGYTHSDIISCIWRGELTKTQLYKKKVCAIIEGRDMDSLPIVLVVGVDALNSRRLAIVAVFPPISEDFKFVI